MPNENIQQAIADLATIRRAIETSGKEERGANWGVVRRGQLLIQGVALGAAAFLLAFEFYYRHEMSWMLQLSRMDRDLAVMGLVEVALCLPFMVAALYFVAWRSARHSDRTLPEFLRKNFTYLRNLNFLSDLFVKFTVLALALLSGHGDWVPALLLLFLGDYLLQGRFFTLPLSLALVLGPLCFAGAGAMYLLASTQLWIPLAVFCGLSLVSIAAVYLRKA